MTKNYTDLMTQYIAVEYTINELEIDDNMFDYDSRSARFINTEVSRRGWFYNGAKITTWTGALNR